MLGYFFSSASFEDYALNNEDMKSHEVTSRPDSYRDCALMFFDLRIPLNSSKNTWRTASFSLQV
jgi:hypothetical protein